LCLRALLMSPAGFTALPSNLTSLTENF
jgi:hypothetical protein